MQPLPDPSVTHKIWARLANLLQRYFKFESVDDGPLLYYRLILWAFGSGELKMRTPYCAHIFSISMVLKGKYSNFKAKSDLAQNQTCVRDFIPVLVICKFENWRHYYVHYIFFFVAQAQVRQMWLDFELVQDSRVVLNTSKFNDDTIKNEGAFTTISPIQVYWKTFRSSRASNSKVNSLIWPLIELVRDFMPVLVTCKFDKDRSKV